MVKHPFSHQAQTVNLKFSRNMIIAWQSVPHEPLQRAGQHLPVKFLIQSASKFPPKPVSRRIHDLAAPGFTKISDATRDNTRSLHQWASHQTPPWYHATRRLHQIANAPKSRHLSPNLTVWTTFKIMQWCDFTQGGAFAQIEKKIVIAIGCYVMLLWGDRKFKLVPSIRLCCPKSGLAKTELYKNSHSIERSRKLSAKAKLWSCAALQCFGVPI